MMQAYDYDKQEWTDGPAGEKLLAQQIETELALLTGPQGKEYADFLGQNLEDAIKAAKTSKQGVVL